jgi:hypothetical protein
LWNIVIGHQSEWRELIAISVSIMLALSPHSIKGPATIARPKLTSLGLIRWVDHRRVKAIVI